jgi:GNAT superfamily N-acetyltransferase
LLNDKLAFAGMVDLASLPAVASRVRMLGPADLALVEQGVAQLSAETLYRRFWRVVRPPDVDLSWVAELAGPAHVAFGACHAGTGEPLGVARAVITGDRAEIAVTVVDRWQRRRIGTRLGLALRAELERRGTSVLTAEVMLENRAAIALLHTLGARVAGPIADGAVEMRAVLR